MAAQLQIPRFKDRSDFQSWWKSPRIETFFNKYPDKLAVLFEHPWVRPYMDVILGSHGSGDKEQTQEIKTFGKYQLVNKLGQGGMGTVYLAFDPTLDRRVALKVVLLKGEDSIKRFQIEAKASARLKHANILPVYETGTVGKYHYFTMDYIDGASLADMIDKKRLNPRQVAGIMKDIASALSYAHKQGIIHRDIKPANILLDKKGVPYLADFGLAKETSNIDRSLTISGTIVGTPDYMSPEQAMGLKARIKQTSDIFSLGSTMYHCITGHLPFRGKELYQVLEEVVHSDPIRPSSLVRRLEPDLETICLKCMEKEADRRYHNAAELEDDLRRYLQGEPIKARPLSTVAKLVRKAKRNKAAVIGIAAAAVILLAVIIASMASSAKTEDKLAGYRTEAYSSFKDNKIDEARIACEKFREIVKTDEEINALYKKCLEQIDKNKTQTKEKAERDKKRAEAKVVLDRAERAPTPDQKIKIAQDALDIDSTYAEAWQLMGMAYKKKPDYDKAVECFSKAIELQPNFAYAYYERGQIVADIWNKPAEAIPDFEKVLKYDPDSHIGWFAKGNIEINQNQYDEAINSYTKAKELCPDFDRAYANCGIAYYYKGNLDKAIAEYTEAIRLEPNDAVVYTNRAIAYYDKGDYNVAIIDCNKALNINPQWVSAYHTRGNAYHAKKDMNKAIADYDEAIRINPKDTKTYNNRGGVYRERNEFDKAIADYSQAIKLDPKYTKAYNNRGNAYCEKGELDKAIADHTEAIRLSPKYADAYNNRGNAYKKKGELDRAITDYNEAIRLDPKYPYAYCNRGGIYYARREFDIAISNYDEAIRLDPKYTDAYYNRGIIYHDKGEFNKAIADYDEAVKLTPQHAKAYYSRGNANYAKGEWDKAITDFTAAIRLNPKYLDAYNNRGNAYDKKKHCDKAIADYTEVIRQDPKYVRAYNNRGSTYHTKGELDKAIADFTAAIRLDPKYANAYYNAAVVWAKKNDYRKAVANGEQFLKLAPNHPQAKDTQRLIEDWRSKIK